MNGSEFLMTVTERRMTTTHWLIISLVLLNVGYYLGRWVGRIQGRREVLKRKLGTNRMQEFSEQADGED